MVMVIWHCRLNPNREAGDPPIPRKKKDGRHINYFIDRRIFERLARYADEKGQPMTTAIERILKAHLDQYESEKQQKGGTTMYCPHCNVLVNGSRCPVCGSRELCNPLPNDYCFLTEKAQIWADALRDVLSQNRIPFLTKNVLGAGLSAKIGPALERILFYVPYAHYEAAQSLEQAFFSAEITEQDPGQQD